MFTDDYLALEELLDWVDELSDDDNATRLKTNEIRWALIPRWKNFLSMHVDRFDRYPEMITHGSTHVCNILFLASELLRPPLKAWKKNRKTPKPINSEELFLLIAGIFLHDIGMATVGWQGNNFHDLRKKHSVRSGEMLRERAQQNTVEDENLLPGFSTRDVNVIVEVVTHHQSSAPLEKKQVTKKSTFRSLEESVNKDPNLKFFFRGKIDIFFVTALLRVLDACDTQYSRTGSVFVTGIKIRNNKRLMKEIKEEIGLLESVLPLLSRTSNEREWGAVRGKIDDYKVHLKYLKNQKDVHFPRHSVIQKVWIITTECPKEEKSKKKPEFSKDQKVKIEVVYKPITDQEKNLLKRFLPEIIEEKEFEKVINNFPNEVKTELCVCNEYLKERGFRIEDKIRKVEEDDIGHIRELMSFGSSFIAAPPAPQKNIIKLVKFDKILSSADPTHNIQLVIGPDGSGKTCLARRCYHDWKDKFKVWYISCGEMKGKSPDLQLQIVFKKLMYFLVSNGDFLFYNKMRTELEMEKSQWSILLGQLDQKEHLFIFDDLHILPLAKKQYPVSQFFDRFFKKLSKGYGKTVIFSRKKPYPLTVGAKIYHKIDVPVFSKSNIEKICSNASYIGFKSLDWPEGKSASVELIKEYEGLPVVLDHIRKTAAMIPHQGEYSARILKKIVNRKMQHHVNTLKTQLENEAKDVLDFMIQYPKGISGIDYLTKYSGLEEETVNQGWKDLESRNLLLAPKNGGKTHKFHFWWALETQNKWDDILNDIENCSDTMEEINDIINKWDELKELSNLKKDILEHSIKVFQGVRNILGSAEVQISGRWKLPLPRKPKNLMLAALLHDIGKPKCEKNTDKGIQYHEHEKKGVGIAREIGTRLDLGRHDLGYLEKLVRYHMEPLHLINNWSNSGYPRERTIAKFASKVAPFASDLFVLARADIKSNMAQKTDENDLHILDDLVKYYIVMSTKEADPLRKPLISGEDLKDLGDELCVLQGPNYRTILEDVGKRDEDGEFTGKEDALKYVKKKYKEHIGQKQT